MIGTRKESDEVEEGRKKRKEWRGEKKRGRSGEDRGKKRMMMEKEGK